MNRSKDGSDRQRGLRTDSEMYLYHVERVVHAQAEQAQTRAAVQEEKELCSNLQSRLADCECMLQQLRNIESRYQEQTKREAPEQYVELQDKIILEKKSTQYKEVSSICKAFI